MEASSIGGYMITNVQEKEFIDINQASALLGLKVSRIRYAIRHKQIPLIKVGRLIRFDKMQLQQWAEKMSQMPTQTPRQLARDISQARKKMREIYRELDKRYGP